MGKGGLHDVAAYQEEDREDVGRGRPLGAQLVEDGGRVAAVASYEASDYGEHSNRRCAKVKKRLYATGSGMLNPATGYPL